MIELNSDYITLLKNIFGEKSNIHNTDFDEILSRSKDFINAIRSPDGDKHIVCQRCFGAPTRRGAAVKTIYNKYLKGSRSNSSSLEVVE